MKGDDHISRLPDALLGEIVSLLRTKEGDRTQALASRWRHIWRSAPLNLDLHNQPHPHVERSIPVAQISAILSSHPGPGRRFAIPISYFDQDAHPAATLDAWLRSPALNDLQELDFHYGTWYTRHGIPARPLPESARRFSSTLRVASFGYCTFPDENGLILPLLKQLSLMHVKISETSLHALLAGCPLLQSLMLTQNIGCSRIRIVSQTLRSIGVHGSPRGIRRLDQFIIEDAPFLERSLLLGLWFPTEMVISVISSPKLKILGQLHVRSPRLEFGTSVFKGSDLVNSTTVLPSVRVLASMECFPCLENLYIKMSLAYHKIEKSRVTNAWRQKYRNLIDTLDIRLKKIVLSTYLGKKAHVSVAEFFVLNARVLESMVLEVGGSNYHNKGWIERQQTLLKIKERASRGARFDFVYHSSWPVSRDQIWYEQVHDLSTADPFVGFEYWATD